MNSPEPGPADRPLLVAEELEKEYHTGPEVVRVLRGVNLSLRAGEVVALVGASGIGKTTLLYILGTLDRPTGGRVLFDGEDPFARSDAGLAKFRRQEIGFVFQFYNLLPVLTALENAALPMLLDGSDPALARQKAGEWLERFELGNRMGHRPDQLSGGQQQRVAIARALVAEPTLILADEPTGNLDSLASDQIAALLARISSEWDRTVLIVTHDPRIAAQADRVLFLKDGRLVDEAVLEGKDGRNAEIVADRLRRMGG